MNSTLPSCSKSPARVLFKWATTQSVLTSNNSCSLSTWEPNTGESSETLQEAAGSNVHDEYMCCKGYCMYVRVYCTYWWVGQVSSSVYDEHRQEWSLKKKKRASGGVGVEREQSKHQGTDCSTSFSLGNHRDGMENKSEATKVTVQLNSSTPLPSNVLLI